MRYTFPSFLKARSGIQLWDGSPDRAWHLAEQGQRSGLQTTEVTGICRLDRQKEEPPRNLHRGPLESLCTHVIGLASKDQPLGKEHQLSHMAHGAGRYLSSSQSEETWMNTFKRNSERWYNLEIRLIYSWSRSHCRLNLTRLRTYIKKVKMNCK